MTDMTALRAKLVELRLTLHDDQTDCVNLVTECIGMVDAVRHGTVTACHDDTDDVHKLLAELQDRVYRLEHRDDATEPDAVEEWERSGTTGVIPGTLYAICNAADGRVVAYTHLSADATRIAANPDLIAAAKKLVVWANDSFLPISTEVTNMLAALKKAGEP